MILKVCIRPDCLAYEGRLLTQFLTFVNCKMQVSGFITKWILRDRHAAVEDRDVRLRVLRQISESLRFLYATDVLFYLSNSQNGFRWQNHLSRIRCKGR